MVSTALLDSAIVQLDSSITSQAEDAPAITMQLPASFLLTSSYILNKVKQGIYQPGITFAQSGGFSSLVRRMSRQPKEQQLLGRRKETARSRQLCLDVKLRAGSSLRLNFAEEATLQQVHKAVHVQAHVPPQRQLLVVCEERARFSSFPQLLRQLRGSWRARPALKSVALSWANFALLPELFNRELYGRGLISWAKTTSFYQALSEAQQAAAATRAAASDQVVAEASCSSARLVRVELLSGAMEHVEVDVNQTLAQVQTLVERRTGVTQQQQRLLLAEQQGPGVVSLFASSLLLRSMAGMRRAASCGYRGSCALARRIRNSFAFPVTVHSSSGACFTIPVTGDMTVDQIRVRVAELELQEASRQLLPPTKPPGVPPPPAADLRTAPRIASIAFPSSLNCALQPGGAGKGSASSMPWLLAWSKAWLL